MTRIPPATLLTATLLWPPAFAQEAPRAPADAAPPVWKCDAGSTTVVPCTPPAGSRRVSVTFAPAPPDPARATATSGGPARPAAPRAFTDRR